ncbi:hypothetical protein ABUE34_12860 [Kozakia baliensis]|uniref:hypothetical protein n=1 Tax=Kozakia baliensis TaxID=153496 RepID=UPI00345C4C89
MSERTVTIEGVMSPDDIRKELSRRCEKRGAKSELARKAGISPSAISDVLSRRREVNEQIANAIGYMAPRFFMPVRGKV